MSQSILSRSYQLHDVALVFKVLTRLEVLSKDPFVDTVSSVTQNVRSRAG
jgi:hypothetical protein